MISVLRKFFDFWYLTILNLLHKPVNFRRPEPEPVSDRPDLVEEYSEAWESSMSIMYAQAMDLILRCIPDDDQKRIKQTADMCCGPGAFTKTLAEALKTDYSLGVDLAEGMVTKGRALGMDNELDFKKGDITKMDFLKDKSFDLVTFMNGAHHLPNLDYVKKALLEAHRIAKDDGHIFFMDVKRLKTPALTDYFCEAYGQSEKNAVVKLAFHQDFIDSMYAAWSYEEILSCLPQEDGFRWVSFHPFGLQFSHYILRLPKGVTELKLNYQKDKVQFISSLVPDEFQAEFGMAQMLLNFGSIKKAA